MIPSTPIAWRCKGAVKVCMVIPTLKQRECLVLLYLSSKNWPMTWNLSKTSMEPDQCFKWKHLHTIHVGFEGCKRPECCCNYVMFFDQICLEFTTLDVVCRWSESDASNSVASRLTTDSMGPCQVSKPWAPPKHWDPRSCLGNLHSFLVELPMGTSITSKYS